MTAFELQWVPYRRPFAVPLRTARGDWFEREGVLLRLRDADGRVGYGEVAPLPEFGTETLAEAVAFLGALGSRPAFSQLQDCPHSLRCCRFALSSALARWSGTWPWPYRLENCALLPTGETALAAVGEYARADFKTFKLKIGVGELNDELALVDALLALLPDGGRLRLDANASLDENTLGHWQRFLAGHTPVEFLEQPLGVGQETLMARRRAEGDLAFALDESVASVADLENVLQVSDWRDPIVIKASVLGALSDLLPILRARRQPLVFSSVFETAIGLDAVLQVAAAAGADEAVGFGTLSYFADALNGFRPAAVLDSTVITDEVRATVWEAVCSGFVRR